MELIKTLSEKSPYFTNLACSLNVGIGFFHFFISGTSPAQLSASRHRRRRRRPQSSASDLGGYYSVVPRQFLWLVEAIGFKADRDLALKELQLASESEGFQSACIPSRDFVCCQQAVNEDVDRAGSFRVLAEVCKGSLAFFLLVTIRTFFFEELEAGRDMFNLLMEQYPYVAGLLPYTGTSRWFSLW